MKSSFLLALLFLCSTSTMNAHAAIGDYLNKAKAVLQKVNEVSDPATKLPTDNSEEITPFADIAWEDSFFNVIEKIQKMGGDRLIISIGNEEVNLIHTTDENETTQKLEQLVQKKAGNLERLKASGLLRSYFDRGCKSNCVTTH